MNYVDFVLPLALLLAVIALLRLWRHSTSRPWMLTISITGLLLLSSNLVASFLSMLLETRYDGRHFADTSDVIVVLSGGIEPADANRSSAILAPDTYARCVQAAELYRSRPARPILVTGRDSSGAMAHFLELSGVSPSQIWQEDRAINTHENAINSSAILHTKGIHTATLVTDAKSMLRAELCFRKDRIDVIPSPVGLGEFELDIRSFIPSWQAIRANCDALHELVGLAWYRSRGWI